MSDVNRLIFEDEEGNDYTLYIESAEPLDLPATPTDDDDDEYEKMGITHEVRAKLQDIHGTLQAYTYYAIGAFRKIPFADVEEMTIKFGIKISGSTGIPILTKGAAEGDFHIEVKCKPKSNT
jgi:hypothetical protein